MSAPWQLDGLSPIHRAWIEEAIARTSFNFGKLIPGLEAQVRRNFIPVEFIDLSRYSQLASWGFGPLGARAHFGVAWEKGHTIDREIDGRRQTLGLAWYSGKVSIEATLDQALATEVFLAEGAHMVDFFWMTPEQREAILLIYHGGVPDETHDHDHDGNVTWKDHGWFEETGNEDYWSWVGESFMYGFTMAFSDIPPTGDAFVHRTTPEIAAQIRELLDPVALYARNRRSSIVHRMKGWHERQIRDTEQEAIATLSEVQAKGLRLCKTCNWNV